MTCDEARQALRELQDLARRVEAQAVRLGRADPDVVALRREIRQRVAAGRAVLKRLTDTEPTAADFVLWLEGRGATFNFRDADTTDWHLDLDGVVDMTKDGPPRSRRRRSRVVTRFVKCSSGERSMVH